MTADFSSTPAYSYGNKEAVDFATKKLALQNPQFVAWVTAYKPPV
jgi:hypothetical protein